MLVGVVRSEKVRNMKMVMWIYVPEKLETPEEPDPQMAFDFWNQPAEGNDKAPDTGRYNPHVRG